MVVVVVWWLLFFMNLKSGFRGWAENPWWGFVGNTRHLAAAGQPHGVRSLNVYQPACVDRP